ncbi:MAG: type II/IV secretion system protein [Nitrospirae bacterium]|nr:type II/IV secretion system protein [Nitrospirota bacterium]MBF0542546.1 type II/IV secretion system protein [Nitrospirota bacterium]
MSDIVINLDNIPKEILSAYMKFTYKGDFFPINIENNKLTFIVSSNSGIEKASFLLFMYGYTGILKYIPNDTLLKIQEDYSYVFDDEVDLAPIKASENTLGHDVLGGSYDDAPAVKLVDEIIRSAVRLLASDIHIEQRQSHLIVRYRIDGRLKTVKTLEIGQHGSVIARIKVLANMDVAESRRAQDGRTNIKLGNKMVDIRVSTLATAKGEKAVLRLLNRSESLLNLDTIGLYPQHLAVLKRYLKHPNGIIIVTGPTGSGKTTTLYSSLLEIQDEALNIMTIEDPIEYQFDGIAQVQVNSMIGITFAKAIRNFLRQDPDVIMVGEIRDEETAHAAIQASLTGHLVLSTLHTNDAPTVVARLVEMNIEPFLLSSSLSLIIAQRLVRKVCQQCKQEVEIDRNIKELFFKDFPDITKYTKGMGCSKCANVGYSGRTSIYEFLIIDDDIRNLIMKRPNSVEVKRLAEKKGMKTLFDHGRELILKGITTPEEIIATTISV